MATICFEKEKAVKLISFRDPEGSVTIENNSVHRTIRAEALPTAAFAKKLHFEFPTFFIPIERIQENQVIHPKIFFPTYPCEWTASHLFQAASRTLDILEIALNKGYTIKDASAYNVLFEHTNPVFVDILSFQRLQETDSFWMAYGQFLRQFVYPLLIHREIGIGISELFKAYPEGLTTNQAKKILPLSSLLKPKIFKETIFLSFLGRLETKFKPQLEKQIQKRGAKELQQNLLYSLRKKIEHLSTRSQKTAWSEYAHKRAHYTTSDLEEKRKGVHLFLDRYKPKTLLDLGCNRGEYALIAARRGISTVAVDNDETCIDLLYRDSLREKLPLLPLVANIANPTPSAGFLHLEKSSLLERFSGSFDAIFCLSLIHHLLLIERIPFKLILEFFKVCKAPYVLLEWISPLDEKAQQLATYSKDRLEQLETPFFERTLLAYCTIEDHLFFTSAERSLYVLKFKS